jgi:hypothetical protein
MRIEQHAVQGGDELAFSKQRRAERRCGPDQCRADQYLAP